MRAYYFDNLPGDQRLSHDCNPSKPVDTPKLASLGLHYWSILVEGHEGKIDQVAKARGYSNRDTINVSKAGLGEVYEAKIKGFFEEHMHEDEEIRYILSGSGYFDVRESLSDSWVRIALSTGDLLVLPAGIYHRFTLDEANHIKAMRLFKDEPKWVPHNRGHATDNNVYRKEYLRSIGVGA